MYRPIKKKKKETKRNADVLFLAQPPPPPPLLQRNPKCVPTFPGPVPPLTGHLDSGGHTMEEEKEGFLGRFGGGGKNSH